MFNSTNFMAFIFDAYMLANVRDFWMNPEEDFLTSNIVYKYSYSWPIIHCCLIYILGVLPVVLRKICLGEVMKQQTSLQVPLKDIHNMKSTIHKTHRISVLDYREQNYKRLRLIS